LATTLLEDEAKRRACNGVLKPVFQGGKKVGVVREYSDTLLIFLLKCWHPARYGDRYRQEAAQPQAKEQRHVIELTLSDRHNIGDGLSLEESAAAAELDPN
jgi:hypothetical protein